MFCAYHERIKYPNKRSFDIHTTVLFVIHTFANNAKTDGNIKEHMFRGGLCALLFRRIIKRALGLSRGSDRFAFTATPVSLPLFYFTNLSDIKGTIFRNFVLYVWTFAEEKNL